MGGGAAGKWAQGYCAGRRGQQNRSVRRGVSRLRQCQGVRFQPRSHFEAGQRQGGQEHRRIFFAIQDLFNTVGEMAVKKRGEGPTTTGGQKVTGKKDKKKKSGCC